MTNELYDQRITRVLTALRDTEAPRGLEARVAARLAQVADAGINTSSPFALFRNARRTRRIAFAGVPLCATLTILLGLTMISFHLHSKPQAVSQSSPRLASIDTSVAMNVKTGFPPSTSVGRSPAYAVAMPGGPEVRSMVPRSTAGYSAPPAADPETVALAETLAPSHPAPHMPLTAQENLLLLVARQGQTVEVAELETLRQPAMLAATEAHEHANLRQHLEGLLAPLAAAENLSPTSPSIADPQSTPEPPSSR